MCADKFRCGHIILVISFIEEEVLVCKVLFASFFLVIQLQ